MKIIPLTKGMVAVVDDGDFEFLNQWEWKAQKLGKKFYAYRSQWFGGEKGSRVVSMHRVIMQASEDEEVDHRDRNTLDNRRSNLRFVTHVQNCANRSLASNNKSGFKGVHWRPKIKRWRATLKSKTLGHFKDPKQAARLYDEKATELFGEFACTNKQLGLLN